MTGIGGNVVVAETTLRDLNPLLTFGFLEGEVLRTARMIESLGVDAIEVGCPSASEEQFSAVAAVAKEARECAVSAQARAYVPDVDTAWNAVKDAKRPRLHLTLPSSDVLLRTQLDRKPESLLKMIAVSVSRARNYCEEVQFTPIDASRARWDLLLAMVDAAIDAGAGVINISDSSGVSSPEEMEKLVFSLTESIVNPRRRHLGRSRPERLGHGCRRFSVRRQGGREAGGVFSRWKRREGGSRVFDRDLRRARKQERLLRRSGLGDKRSAFVQNRPVSLPKSRVGPLETTRL